MKPLQAGTANISKTKAIQSRLSQLGYFHGEIDGNFGQNTTYAMIAFQKERGIADDGIVGVVCWTELFGVKSVQ